jgi:hypothetical protein
MVDIILARPKHLRVNVSVEGKYQTGGYSMKKLVVFAILAVMTLCSVSGAMKLDPGSIALVTTNPNAMPQTWSGTFALCHPNQMAVWFDYRDPNFMAVYGVRLDEPPYDEFGVDLSNINSNSLAAGGHIVAQDFWRQIGFPGIRVTDFSDVNNPIHTEMESGYVRVADVSGSLVVFCLTDPNTYEQRVNVLDVSDPCNIIEYCIAVLPAAEALYGLAMDGNHVVWSVDNAGIERYVRIADISDLSNPVISTVYLPEQTFLQTIDVSGMWLVASGWDPDRGSVFFAVPDYTDTTNWTILVFRQNGDNGEYFVSPPRIDGQIAVWAVSTNSPSMTAGTVGQDGRGPGDSEWRLKSVYLRDDENYIVSTLRSVTWSIDSAEVVGNTAVWSENQWKAGLYKGDILFECGDWGYEPGDLNRDCYVDFKDLALIADDWLRCTLPDGLDCGYGPFK